MTKIAIIVDGDRVYPILRHKGAYHVDFGGSVGLSDAFSFKRDTEAINWLRNALTSHVLSA